MPNGMKWSSAISENQNFERALKECCQKTGKELGGAVDLAFVFLSPHFSRFYPQVPEEMYKHLSAKTLLGCSAGGLIGGGREVEQKLGMSVIAAKLPDVSIHPFYITNEHLPDSDAAPKAWHELMGIAPDKNPQFVLLSDPFSIDSDKFVMGLDYAFMKSVKVGGLASGAKGPGENALFLNHDMHHEGLVGVALSGNIHIDSVVAQGCRPIGSPMVVTNCQENVLLELDGKPPIRILEELYENLTPRDQQLLRTSLFVGMVMDATKSDFTQGDFLVRNIVGADPERGVLAIGADLRLGQTLQFHLRDSHTSSEDLDHMLTRYNAVKGKAKPKGALLFSCLGRGEYLYGSPDHDTKVFGKMVGEVPLGGFFCNGEIGPVNNTTYIHGYTSCFGIFSENPALKK